MPIDTPEILFAEDITSDHCGEIARRDDDVRGSRLIALEFSNG